MNSFSTFLRKYLQYPKYFLPLCRAEYKLGLLCLYLIKSYPHDVLKILNIGRFIRCQKNCPGVGFEEYLKYHLFALTTDEQKNFLLECIYPFQTLTMNKKIVPYLKEKDIFLQRYAVFIHRAWMKTNNMSYESFAKFCASNRSFIYKPRNLQCGNGVKQYHLSDERDIMSYYHHLKNTDGLIEGLLINHPHLKALHPSSLNTIRVVTISNPMKSEILYALLRVGVGKSIVDNTSSGGVTAIINLESGMIESEAFDFYSRKWTHHPDSNIEFKGFIIPNWEMVKKTCLDACRIIGDYGIIGWDVAVLPNDEVALVEGNSEAILYDTLQCYNITGYKHILYDKIVEYYGHKYDEELSHLNK